MTKNLAFAAANYTHRLATAERFYGRALIGERYERTCMDQKNSRTGQVSLLPLAVQVDIE